MQSCLGPLGLCGQCNEVLACCTISLIINGLSAPPPLTLDVEKGNQHGQINLFHFKSMNRHPA